MSTIRIASKGDANEVLTIYKPYVLNTSFTFETELPSVETFADRIDHYLDTWPWLVCEINNKVVGYTYASRHRERAAYQWCVESSIYILDEFQKTGIAKALYAALLEILKIQGFRNVYAGITLPNDKSVKFHEQSGFRHFANFENIGFKKGRWNTVSWWQLSINDHNDDPAPPIKFSELNKDFLPALFTEKEKLIRI